MLHAIDEDGSDAGRALRLATAMATRLCHELSGPAGTVGGAIDLAVDDPSAAAEAISVAHEAARIMVSRLRLLRAAWGGGEMLLDAATLAETAAILPGRRPHIDTTRLCADEAFTPSAARVMLNVLLLAAESMPAGGTIAIAGAPDGDVEVTIDGPRAAWPDELALCLVDPDLAWTRLAAAPGLDTREMQVPLTAMIARAAGIGLSLLDAAATNENQPLLLRCARAHRTSSL